VTAMSHGRLRVGIIGAGVMGLTVGRKLIELGRRVMVFDVVSAAGDKARQAGAQVAALCPIVLVSLPGPA
jgi:3-hydroxyisobutyrate dehydrogenase-like beta-hydroxyacid dehydrogenase